MQIRTWRLAFGALLLSGSPVLSAQQAPYQPAPARNVSFHCPGGKTFTARFTNTKPQSVSILFEGSTEPVELPLAISASGARYTDGKTTFWTKGNEALFESPGLNLNGCKAASASAPSPSAAGPPLLETFWRLIELNNQAASSPAGARQVYIQFTGGDEKRASGFSGCNRYTGSYESEGSDLKFGQMASTRMACVGPNRESEFLDALKRTNSYRISGNALELMEGSNVLARFEAAQK